MQYFSIIDVFAIPSIRDGCPNSLLEAMLARKAIIGSDVDAIGEIIEHKVNGIKIKPGSRSDLVAAIGSLANNPQFRDRLGEAAYKTAIDKLAPHVERSNWQSVYERVLNNTSRRLTHAVSKTNTRESHAVQ